MSSTKILTSLQQEVVEIIRTHSTPDQKPPFTMSHIVVMALVSCSEMTTPDVVKWIESTFQYYSTMSTSAALELMSQHTTIRHRPIAPSDVGSLFELAKVFDGHRAGGDAEDGPPVYITKEKKWYTRSSEARIFLRIGEAGPPTSGATPFLKLPPELRNTVYAMVSGVYCNRQMRPKFLRSADPTIFGVELVPRSGPARTLQLNDFLALTCVNKEIRGECLKMFFALEWSFDGLVNFDYFTRHVLQFSLLTSIHLNLVPSELPAHRTQNGMDDSLHKMARGVVRLANLRNKANLPTIESLTIEADDEDWEDWFLQYGRVLRGGGNFLATAVPGVTELNSLTTVKKLCFQGDCEQIMDALTPLRDCVRNNLAKAYDRSTNRTL